jgi:hypothetical protein
MKTPVPPVSRWVQDFCAEAGFVAPFKIGDCVQRPGGPWVKIVAGTYWGKHRISNQWEWRGVRRDGSLGPVDHGDGWVPKAA